MKEFSIEIICNGGKPYRIGVYNDFRSCMNSLENLVNLERERRRPYFVDLDFFENDYTDYISGKYFRIIERNVSKWNNYNNKNYNEDSKVIKIY